MTEIENLCRFTPFATSPGFQSFNFPGHHGHFSEVDAADPYVRVSGFYFVSVISGCKQMHVVWATPHSVFIF